MDKHELYVAAKHAESPTALLELAHKHRIKMDEEESKKLYLQLHKSGKIPPDDLNEISGGSGCSSDLNVPTQQGLETIDDSLSLN